MEINLEKILEKSGVGISVLKKIYSADGKEGNQLDRIKNAMIEVCELTLRLAVENADEINDLDENLILNIIKQIK